MIVSAHDINKTCLDIIILNSSNTSDFEYEIPKNSNNFRLSLDLVNQNCYLIVNNQNYGLVYTKITNNICPIIHFQCINENVKVSIRLE